MTPHEFYQLVIGKAYDMDKAFGNQCWDGFAYYMNKLGYPVFHCNTSGFVKDIWNNRKTSGILKYCDEVQRPFQDGDIIVWTNCAACPYSHIAIFRKDNGNGTFVALGQNQGGANGAFSQMSFTYDGVMGGLRPKCYAKPAAKPKPTTIKDGGKGAVYRVYNTNSGDHLYTTSIKEAQNAVNAGWKYEGAAWKAPEKGDAVYRMYNPNGGQHHFTVSAVEKSALIKAGWKSEGVAFYSSGSGTIYRMYNPKGGQHLLTTSRAEHDSLVKAGWACEESHIHF